MGLGELYSFDTSAFINGQRDQFPPDLFPDLWPRIDGLAMLGQVQSVDVVRDELVKRDDDVHAWAKARPHLFVTLSEEIQLHTRAVLRACPKLIGVGSGRSGADPFVIALAMCNDGVVVTDENPTQRPTNPRIPDACDAVGVRCLNLLGFIREQGWTFT